MSTPEPRGGDRDEDAAEIDACFAAIVAGWGAGELSWPSDDGKQVDPEPPETATPESAQQEPVQQEPVQQEPVQQEPVQQEEGEDWAEDEGHYEPPDPPPIPRPRAPTLGAMILIGIGVVLLFIPAVIGLTDIVGFPVGLLSVASGLFWLFLLLRDGPPIDSGWDDGSQL